MGQQVVAVVVKYKNNWIPTKTLAEMSNTRYDVLIVGSGPGEEQSFRDFANCGKIEELKRL